MSSPEFDIQIGKDGKVKVRIHGVSGAECIELADMLRDIVGQEDSRQKTPEFYGPGSKVRFDTSVRGRISS